MATETGGQAIDTLLLEERRYPPSPEFAAQANAQAGGAPSYAEASANFAADGGCKKQDFWGSVNYVDHEHNFQLKSTQITGYLFDPANPNSRDICGKARVNDSAFEVMFRVHLEDNGEPGMNDKFGIIIDNWNAPTRFYVVTSRKLANGEGGGGNVQLHKGNNSNTASDAMLAMQEWQMCGDLDSPQ